MRELGDRMGQKCTHITDALYILRKLAERPYPREESIVVLGEFLEQTDRKPGDVAQKLHRIVRELRDLGFAIDCAPHRPYTLVESKFPLILSATQRQSLYLAVQFLEDMGFATQAQQIAALVNLDETDAPPDIQVDFSPPADYSNPDYEKILHALQDRCAQQYRYRIHYCNSQKQNLRLDLDRSEIRLHDGALYLFAFVPDWKPKPRGGRVHNVENNGLFRIDRIKSVGAPSRVGWVFSEFPTLKIRYRMSGPLATYKPRRSQERVVERDLVRRYVEIETEEDYLFWFRQRIFRYGANARVLDPPWLAAELGEELRRAAAQYEADGSRENSS